MPIKEATDSALQFGKTFGFLGLLVIILLAIAVWLYIKIQEKNHRENQEKLAVLLLKHDALAELLNKVGEAMTNVTLSMSFAPKPMKAEAEKMRKHFLKEDE